MTTEIHPDFVGVVPQSREDMIKATIESMKVTYHGLMEASKTANGNPSYSTQACSNRTVCGEISKWITQLKKAENIR